MALFSRKNSHESGAEEPAGGRDVFMPAPDKAAAFFKHAQAVHETGNYEYATTLWLQGLRMDPASMTGLELFFGSAQACIGAQKKFGPTKDQARTFGPEKGRVRTIEKYLSALLEWGTRPLDAASGVRAMEAGGEVEVDLGEQVYWIGERTLAAALSDKKPRKDVLLRIKDAAAKVGAFDLAVKAGEQALRLDPSDSALDDQLRNLSAQATMSKGGYESAGKEGGFRSSIRDAAAQRVLQEQDAISKSGTMADRTLEAARTDYETRTTDPYAVERYVRELVARETDEHDAVAQRVLDRAFKETQEFRWRRIWGDLEIRKLKRALRPVKAALDASPDDPAARRTHEEAARAFLQAEIAEFRSRAEAYPTNLEFKYELGRRLFEAGSFKEAITLLQRAQEDPKRRASVLDYLARCFLAIGFSAEAIGVFRQAIEAASAGAQEPSLELRYGLLTALQSKAQDERDLVAAQEAAGIASAIAMQQFDFKDIMERRQAIQSLVNELRQARAGG